MFHLNNVNTQLIEYIETDILTEYDKNERGHGLEHIEYVLKRCFKFAEQFDCINPDILYTIAVYHDIGHHIDKKRHEFISAEIFMTDEFMKSYFNEAERNIIKEAIEDHRASSVTTPRSDYGKIISSADRSTDLDEFLIRTHSYTLKHFSPKSNQEIIDRAYQHASDKYGEDGYAKHYLEDEEYNEFLSKIRSLLKNKSAFAEYYRKTNKIKKDKHDMKPNIIFYFSDQQRWDTVNETVMPNLTEFSTDGIVFDNSFTCQPVCGPARACLQTGQYATENKCYWNGIPLPQNTKTLADHFNENGYDTAYIGKWHLASDRTPGFGFHCEKTAIPKERQGGYKYFRGADVLEFTSHGYDGYVFDEDGNKIEFKGYRADCINNFALEYLKKANNEKPFFMFISQLEPHHQNDHGHFEGPKETIENFKDYPIPPDLSFLKGDYKEEYPDYIAAINRLDENLGRLVDTLKELNLYDNSIIIYTSDHGCHFKTRNFEYKRSCHESSIHTPLVFFGGAVEGGVRTDALASLVDLPPTMLSLAGIEIPDSYSGYVLPVQDEEVPRRDCVFIQISESHVGRCVRTKRWKYSAKAIGSGWHKPNAKHYFDDFLYDLENDPNEMNNLIDNENYLKILMEMRNLLSREMVSVGEKAPVFHKKRRK